MRISFSCGVQPNLHPIYNCILHTDRTIEWDCGIIATRFADFLIRLTLMKTLTWLKYLFKPIDEERRQQLRSRWAELRPELQTEAQAIGHYTVGCGATHGIYERCDFGCTACYLGSKANKQEAMPFAQVNEQLESLRTHLGPGGNVQITSGEVTLLPLKNLVRILKRSVSLGLSPMVMTHGDVILHDPAYLDQLVLEGGLDKISIHVDITQRGRKGVSREDSEGRLNRVRDQMANLLRESRTRTGRKLKAASTLTVNRANLDQLRNPICWFLRNLDSFRIMSFQPQADTGRTRSGDGVSGTQVWQQLEKILEQQLNPHPVQFGHEACNKIALLVAMETGKQRIIMEAVRKDNPVDRRFIDGLLANFGGLVAASRPPREVLAKVIGFLLRRPLWLLRIPLYILRRTWQERQHIPAVLGALPRLKLRIRPFAFVVQAFMSRHELNEPEGRERLAGCTFKLPVNGEMVSMCEMNGTDLRENSYQQNEEALQLP